MKHRGRRGLGAPGVPVAAEIAEVVALAGLNIAQLKTRLASIQRKIAARNRTEIAVWAWESGLVR
ncbi:hypothetical protein [Amycolatopsis keratiniphila]|uniref:hypothetical protein n=1 Tax=Amycolatopsis keratiniphila TaxID=129921 RepID=UPI0003A0FDF3|nr:hypothetical protein [Amycolatopsis keratiniphila]